MRNQHHHGIAQVAALVAALQGYFNLRLSVLLLQLRLETKAFVMD
jgi:hypothetical protein